MKNSTRKLLFCLSRQYKKEPLYASFEQCQGFLPQLSKSGLRSLLSLLKKQHLISSEPIAGQTTFRITDLALQTLIIELPVLSTKQATWDGTWSCLVFKEAPPHDQQFRYLRDFLLKKGALALSRGVYLYPGEFPESVLTEGRERYRTNITIFSIGEWLHGDDRLLITEKYALLDLAQSYSGISTEIDRLINTKKGYSTLTNQDKKHLFSLFDRLYETAAEDRGLLTHYFPQVPSVIELLSRLQAELR